MYSATPAGTNTSIERPFLIRSRILVEDVFVVVNNGESIALIPLGRVGCSYPCRGNT